VRRNLAGDIRGGSFGRGFFDKLLPPQTGIYY